MEITTKEFKHCHLLAVEGRVDSATAPQFGEKLETVIEGGVFKIVIDMSKLEYMSSAGFRALLSAQRQCKRYNRGKSCWRRFRPHSRGAGIGGLHRAL
jgi:anti-sigma B factor antagonist